jgi:pimeloyl-ACP methyl ester carboxylesterase
MCASNPHVQAVEVADASHYVHDDQGEVFNRLVAGFLSGLVHAGQ